MTDHGPRGPGGLQPTSATEPTPPPQCSPLPLSHTHSRDCLFDDQSSQHSPTSLHPPPPALQQTATEALGISIPRLHQSDLTPPSSNASLAHPDDNQPVHAPAKAAVPSPSAACPAPHDPASARPGSQSPTSPSSSSQQGLAGRKRTATGDLKIAPPATGQPPSGTSSRPGPRHARTSSTFSNGSSSVTEISAQLRTRLKHAMIKVQNGWTMRSLEELESTATDSPRSTVSGFQHAAGHVASPQGGANPPFYRKWSDSTSSESNPSDPLASTHYANSRAAPAQPTNGFSTRSLAPPADIRPGSRRRPSPNDAFAVQDLAASPSVRPSTSRRTPSQNAAMEADAVETLLFMASPNNSGYHPASHDSSLRSTLNLQTSPLRTRFSQISASSPKRVSFQDYAAPPLFKTREAQIDHLLDTMPDDSDDDLDPFPLPPPKQHASTHLS